MKIDANGSLKITVWNVAKLTFTILLGYKIGKALADVPGSLCEGIIEKSVDASVMAFGKKLGINENSSKEEIDEKVDAYFADKVNKFKEKHPKITIETKEDKEEETES